jgi:hypothetical protein
MDNGRERGAASSSPPLSLSSPSSSSWPWPWPWPGSGWAAGALDDVPNCNQHPQLCPDLTMGCCSAARLSSLVWRLASLVSAALLLACAPECNRQRATGRRGSMRVPARAARVEDRRAGVAQRHGATDMGALMLGCWDVGMLSRAARMGEGRGAQSSESSA